MDNETVPQKIFNRHSSLKNCQFNNYQCAPNKQWFLLAGILQTDHQTNGTLQLYSTKRKASQIIKADIASLATVKIGDNSEVSTILILFSSIAQKYNLHLIEVGTPPVGNQPYSKKEIAVMHQDQMDNPIAMQTSTQFDIIFLITKLGYIHIYDLETASCIFVNRISTDIIIVTAPHELSDGIITVNSKGQVISASIDKSQIIPYIKNELQNRELALRIAYRNNLSGAEDVCESKFHNLLQSGQYFNAARFAALSPQGYLRTYKTIEALRNMNDINEQRTSAVLEYFNILLDRGKLNNHETIEYCRIILPQDPKQCRKWLNLEKLLCTEELGNLMKQYDVLLALSVYICLNVHSKVVQCFIETGQFQEAISYALRVKYTPDYMQLLQTVMFLNSEQGALFAKELVVNKLCEINDIIDIFMEQKLVQQCTTFLLDVLTHNRAGDGQLQTRLLEINLLFSPKEADNIFEKKLFSHYDRIHIAKLCEKAGLNQRCLEHYTDFNDIKRCIVQTNSLSEDWIINFFEKLPVNDSLKYLQAMLTADIQKNYKICVQIGVKHHEKFDVNVLIDLFEQYGNSEVLFHFLTEISVKNGFPNEKFIQEIEKREGLGLLLQWLQKRINEDCKNPQIENLLILTAIKADRTQVGDYIKRLHNYDINSIASSAIRNELYEEAFMVFNKFKINTSAIKVLIENIGSLERAKTFAENSDDPAVWSILVDFQLKQGFVKESMKNYVKSKDSNMYTDIVCAAKSANLWSELIVFYEKLNYYDSAILEMMAHPKEAWQKNKFEEMINKVNNIELYYKAIKFYSERKPFLLSDILIIMSPYLDHQRAINMLKETRQLPLIKRYLYTVQSLNCQYINEALNEILIIENDYVGLQNSITMLDNYDKFKLAQQLKDHKFAKYRRIAASLYKGIIFYFYFCFLFVQA